MNVGVRAAEGIDGSLVILAAWCPTCHEEVGPNRDGTCGDCGTRILDEDLLSARDLVAQAREPLPTPIPNGGEVTTATATCKIDGCNESAVDRVGMYAKLCTAHKDEKRNARGPASLRSSRPMSSLVAHAATLVKLAKAHEKAQAKLTKIPAASRAKTEFDEAVRRASMSPTPENLDRVQQATKQLRPPRRSARSRSQRRRSKGRSAKPHNGWPKARTQLAATTPPAATSASNPS